MQRNHYVIIETNLGSFEVELYWDESKSVCSRFYELCESGYYNECIFNRVISDFMIQVEGRDGVGVVRKDIEEEEEEDCNTNSLLRFTGAGIVAWILSSSTSCSNQFFITLAPTPWLDSTTDTKEYRIFGRIKSGLGVIKRIGLVKTDTQTNR
jgi:peptidyl-prolyl cis-trans isomerase-like 1